MTLDIAAVYEQALKRYYDDAEKVGITAEPPLGAPESSVQISQGIVSFRGQRGLLAAYAFRVDEKGRVRLRPLLNY